MSEYHLSIHDSARQELLEAVAYFNEKSGELAQSFLDEIKESLDLIKQFPKHSTQVKRTIRRNLLVRFPYAFFYTVTGFEIRILAFGHTRRRPFYWQNRT
ncbi:MAG: type II toxin-antitoxin system RelE/ParE family toxin [Coriobacteriia bacterium]|nr:type II toxin-antitoxin system RelE/ParE family toxin [Coriobacteriia bacterium]